MVMTYFPSIYISFSNQINIIFGQEKLLKKWFCFLCYVFLKYFIYKNSGFSKFEKNVPGRLAGMSNFVQFIIYFIRLFWSLPNFPLFIFAYFEFLDCMLKLKVKRVHSDFFSYTHQSPSC